VTDYLRRLLRTGAAYQAGDVTAKVIALALLPVYTRHLSRADYGTAELLLTVVILLSIVVRLGLGEALVRFHYLDADLERRRRIARTATGVLFATTTLTALAAALAAGPLSELLLGQSRPAVLRAAALGLWAFTNLELANALLRVDERARAFLTASLANVSLTVGLTLWLVVGRGEGALGLLLGNFAASAAVLVGLWVVLRDSLGLRPGVVDRGELGTMLRFGLPTVPAEVSVFALFFVDRLYLYRVESADAAGLYSLSVKLAAGVIFTVRAFQYAWPPLAYSISDDAEASRVYARITTYYALVTGVVVVGLSLLGRWVVRLFAAPQFFGAHEALPWVALGWALYGLFLVLVAMAGRAQVTIRNAPAALCGLVVNVILLALLVGPLGIAGAGLALVGAFLVMLAVMYALTRRLFPVAFEWGRLALLVGVMGAIAGAGELLAPTDGAGGFVIRLLALAAVLPVLWGAGFFRSGELAAARGLWRRLVRRPLSAPG
jgi:O-antigen/teichoic acid export membrane protein